jgi:hypothetical protein
MERQWREERKLSGIETGPEGCVLMGFPGFVFTLPGGCDEDCVPPDVDCLGPGSCAEGAPRNTAAIAKFLIEK